MIDKLVEDAEFEKVSNMMIHSVVLSLNSLKMVLIKNRK